jgi:hypothetical protein
VNHRRNVFNILNHYNLCDISCGSWDFLLILKLVLNKSFWYFCYNFLSMKVENVKISGV